MKINTDQSEAKSPAAGSRPWLELLLAALFVGVLGLLTYRLATRSSPENSLVLQDFRDAIYYPVVSFLDGRNPYDTADYMRTYPVGQEFPLYSPITLLAHLPFGLLPFKTARLVYYVFSACLTLVLAHLTLRFCHREPRPYVFGLAALMLLSRPGHMNLLNGQCTLQVVIGAYVALVYATRRPWLAALGLALATLKPTFGVPLALLILARGKTRSVFIGLTVAGLASATVSFLLVRNAGGVGSFVQSLFATHAIFNAAPTVDPLISWGRLDAWALFGQLVGHTPSAAVELVISLVILGLAVLGVRRQASEQQNGSSHISDTLTCLAVLACTYHQTYDALLLVLPLLAIATDSQLPGGQHRGTVRWVVLALLAVPFVNYLATEPAISGFGITGDSRVAIISLNGIALLVALVVYTALAFMRNATLEVGSGGSSGELRASVHPG